MKKSIIILLIILFGIMCGIGGLLYSNLLLKKNQSIGEARRAEYEKKFIEVTQNIMVNADLSAKIIDGVSSAWRSAIMAEGRDFNEAIRRYLTENKETLYTLEGSYKRIIRDMQDLKDYPPQYQEAYGVLMELYGVYSQIYTFASNPSGSLISYNNKTNELSSEFGKVASRLIIYMPKVKEETKPKEELSRPIPASVATPQKVEAPTLNIIDVNAKGKKFAIINDVVVHEGDDWFYNIKVNKIYDESIDIIINGQKKNIKVGEKIE